MKIKNIGYLIAVLALVATSMAGCKGNSTGNNNENDSTNVVKPRVIEYGLDVTDYEIVRDEVPSGKLITTLLRDLGADSVCIAQAVLIPDSVFDVRHMKAGNMYSAYYKHIGNDTITKLAYLVYQHSQTDFVIFHLEDSLHVEQFHKPTRVETRVREAVIETSLWDAIEAADMNLLIAVKLAEIYECTVDFFGLQKGDAFKVYYDEVFVDSLSIGVQKIYGACYKHADKKIYTIFYENGDLKGFWDLKGESLRKAFLKAPLKFTRISSKFSYARLHPIYKVVRPHTGVDYAAPTGTPVVSIGDGEVIAKGYRGGGGNTVKIKHNKTYQTAYLHLSKFGEGIEVGAHVEQGQVVGYVGSTGAATGPHLDFRVWENGEPVDPLNMNQPSADPLPDSCKAEFDSIKQVVVFALDSVRLDSVKIDAIKSDSLK